MITLQSIVTENTKKLTLTVNNYTVKIKILEVNLIISNSEIVQKTCLKSTEFKENVLGLEFRCET